MKKKINKIGRKQRIFDEIQKVLNFGNDAKQITKMKLIQNPTIDDLKKSAIKLKKRNKFKLNLGNIYLKIMIK